MEDKIQIIKKWLGSGSVNIFGPPFSGKDTQAGKLAELFDGKVVSGGDILRHNHGNQQVQKIMAEGGIIPSKLFLEIIPPFFAYPEYAGKPMFLSSVGRLMSEVPVIMNAASGSGHPVKAVILLDLSEEGVWKHYDIAQSLKDRGERADDSRQSLEKRLDEYAKTQPVLDYYESQGLLSRIDDSKTPEEVFDEIIETLFKRAAAQSDPES